MIDDKKIDIVMLSKFRPSEGGRETWAYQFIPRVLVADPKLNLHVYGLSINARENSDAILRKSVKEADRDRLETTFLANKKSKIPKVFLMLMGLRRYFRHYGHSTAEIVIGVGGFLEGVLIHFTYKKSPKQKRVLWLRTIYSNEIAERVPRLVLPLIRILEKWILKKFDVLIANGECTADYYRNIGFEVKVIPNAVNIDYWSLPEPEIKLPINVSFIGRLAKVKGIEEFSELAHRIKMGMYADKFTFHLIGGGLKQDSIKKLIKEGKILYHGEVDNANLRPFLTMTDVCVALTWASIKLGGGGVSNALLEQLAARRVLVAWDNNIFNRVLDENTAYLIEQGNVGGLEACLLRIIKNLDMAKSKASNGHDRVKRFSFEKHVSLFFEYIIE